MTTILLCYAQIKHLVAIGEDMSNDLGDFVPHLNY
jgi:hypothetical protein